MKIVIPFLFSLILTVDAQSLCGNNDFCSVWQVTTTTGECSAGISVCDDGDDSTESSCEPNSSKCAHVARDPESAPVCFAVCVPDCQSKECGEDGCGGFCGQCEDGFGCSNYACVSGVAWGSCSGPLNLGDRDFVPVVGTTERVTLTSFGDTSQSFHFDTPSCNTLTSGPEMVYAFEVASGMKYGYDIRTSGYDTVVQLMKGTCGSKGLPDEHSEDHIINCNDDGTPPGNMGSRISGEIEEGIYFIMVDGYSLTDSGPFELLATFVRNCTPLCDGNFCGSDGCGGTCGSCGDGEECNISNNRCFPTNCRPQCKDRECGEDGCGGSCGACDVGLFCLGVSIAPDEETGIIPTSRCTEFQVCDHMNPVCESCGGTQICASDCQCYDSLDNLGDLLIMVEHMLEESFLQDVNISESSCSLVEGCVAKPGVRRLLRFTSSILNQGKADIFFPEPKQRPDLFKYGPCHQHYHFEKFAEYTLFQSNGKTIVLNGQKSAYCMEDTARHFDGSTVACDKKYDCGFQGIQKGWLDSYAWDLDCSWIDVTDLDAGDYVLEVRVNPGRVFPEISFDNNAGRIRVNIPEVSDLVSQPLKLVTGLFNATNGTEQDNQFEPPVGSSALFILGFTNTLVACIVVSTISYN